MAQHIYVAEEDNTTRDLISTYLKNEGFETSTFPDGPSLLAACHEAMPDLVVMDVQLPGIDGLSACSHLRRLDTTLPIIMLSDTDSAYERVTGFSFGCDDYLVIPFLPLELVARVRAVLRRSTSGPAASEEEQPQLAYGPLTLYPEQRTAYISDTKLSLTPAEFDFLSYLIQHAGSAVSRKELLKNLWQSDWQADTRATDDLVKRLRRKLREIHSPVQIVTVWGYGFRLTMEEA